MNRNGKEEHRNQAEKKDPEMKGKEERETRDELGVKEEEVETGK